jgi:hypothetical protein
MSIIRGHVQMIPKINANESNAFSGRPMSSTYLHATDDIFEDFDHQFIEALPVPDPVMNV